MTQAQLTRIEQLKHALEVGAGGVGIRGDNEGIVNLGVLIQQAAKPGASKEDLRRAYPATRCAQVKQAVQGFADTFSKGRFLVTSRTYAYQHQDWKLTGFAEVALRPFTPGQVQRFVEAWYAHMSELERLSDSRGTAGRVFPWAEDWRENCPNTIEAGFGDTCAVGLFPNGRSEAGCLDMAGNVWEWTRSQWDKDLFKPDFPYPYDPGGRTREDLEADNDVRRVLRGGSWLGNRDFVRCAYRDWDLRDLRYYDIGFRVVVRSAPVP